MNYWTDTHCHLDAPELAANLPAVVARAAAVGVVHAVLPAVAVRNFEKVRDLAHSYGYSYALGIHPLCVPESLPDDLKALDAALSQYRHDPRLVAVGEIGLDFFVPALQQPDLRNKQIAFYRAQLKLARQHGLPVILHVRRSADVLLKHLRQIVPDGNWSGIAHAFNGSAQQAMAFVNLGFKLGFGGAVTFEAALQLRRLATELPLTALVMETDSPDIPPHWLYTTALQRASGVPQGVNSPGELPRVAQVVADLRSMPLAELARATTANAVQALPKLRDLLD